MPIVKYENGRVTLDMSYEEYRDLTETLTATGNDSWRHANCPNPHNGGPTSYIVRHIREGHAQSAWTWSKGIGIPVLNEGELKSFQLEPFQHLGGGTRPVTRETGK